MITKSDVKHISNIAKLKFDESELDTFTEKFAQVLDFVNSIKEVNTDNIEPTYQINEETVGLKEDGEVFTITREEVLQNAHEEQYGYFKILKVVE